MLNIQRPPVMKNIQDYTWDHCAFPSLNFQTKLAILKRKYTWLYPWKMHIIILKVKFGTCKNFQSNTIKNAAGLKWSGT